MCESCHKPFLLWIAASKTSALGLQYVLTLALVCCRAAVSLFHNSAVLTPKSENPSNIPTVLLNLMTGYLLK